MHQRMTEWAKDNMRLSHLEDKEIRFIVDDCKKFVERETRRETNTMLLLWTHRVMEEDPTKRSMEI